MKTSKMAKSPGKISKPVALAKSAPAKSPKITAIQPVSERFPTLEKQDVLLTLDSPNAQDVKVAGCFNNWQPERTPMKKAADGGWIAHLAMRSGQYQYRFVVDGSWIEDPFAQAHVPNHHGGFNSILEVPLSVRTSIL